MLQATSSLDLGRPSVTDVVRMISAEAVDVVADDEISELLQLWK